jgi:hypothetical protein
VAEWAVEAMTLKHFGKDLNLGSCSLLERWLLVDAFHCWPCTARLQQAWAANCSEMLQLMHCFSPVLDGSTLATWSAQPRPLAIFDAIWEEDDLRVQRVDYE